MQLKALSTGRFQQQWTNEYSLIESVILSCVVEKRTVPVNSLILKQGTNLKNLMLVKKGKVSFGYCAGNGRVFQLGSLMCDDQLLGEMEFFSNYRCQMNVQALESVEVWEINGERLQKALLTEPKLALFFASAIAIDYQDTIEIFTQRLLHPIAYNIALDLYQRERNERKLDSFQKDYLEAERFGTTDRVYRRAIKLLEGLSLIKKEKNTIHVIDITKLKAFLEQKM